MLPLQGERLLGHPCESCPKRLESGLRPRLQIIARMLGDKAQAGQPEIIGHCANLGQIALKQAEFSSLKMGLRDLQRLGQRLECPIYHPLGDQWPHVAIETGNGFRIVKDAVARL